MTAPDWVIVVSHAARQDIRDIRRWSARTFGTRQTDAYVGQLMSAIQTLAQGPTARGVRQRSDLPAGMLVLRAPSARRRGQHFAVLRFDTVGDRRRVLVLRILHTKMDLPRYLKPPA